jgi:hypothetical protein
MTMTAEEPSTTFEQRLAAVTEEAMAEDNPPVVVGDEPVPPPAEPTPPPDTVREERRARLEALRAREQANAAKTQRHREQARLEAEAGEVAKLRSRVQELEKLDAAFADEASFLAAAEAKGINPQKLADWVRETLTSPEKVAAREAKGYLTEAEKRMAGTIAGLEERLARFENLQTEQSVNQAEYQAAQTLINHVVESSHMAPLSAAFVERHGAGTFVEYAQTVARQLPPGSGLQALHDAIEDHLENLQLGTKQPSQSRSGAAKPQTRTLSNAQASQRTAVAEETDLSALSFDERLARIKGLTG